ncbi:putative 4-coumarate--CoA ligase-like 8 [Typha latifolia]|uniref:putative 4-coumarate--CoA ligase-like 8 n=1 Tax=Typha latifolia TaxID=4733 RepID=UPI003C2E332F
MEDGSGFSSTSGIYRSLYPSPPLHSFTSLTDFLFSNDSPNFSPTKPAFVDASTGASLSYSDLRRLSSSAASALSAAGLRRGHIALLVSTNSISFPLLSLAVLSLGAVLSTANPLLTRSELLSQIRDSDPALVITTLDLALKFEFLGSDGPDLVLIETLIGDLDVNPTVQIGSPDVGPSDPAAMMYSSGTTGKSKGVVSTQGNLIAMAHVLRHLWGEGDDEVYGCVVPMYHMFGFSVFVCGVVAAGATAVVVSPAAGRFNVADLAAAVERHRITRLPAVPPMVVMMARKGHAAGRYWSRSLREVICSGAPLGREHLEKFGRCYPGIRLSQCYGLTETCGPVTLCDGVRGRLHASIGRLIPSVEAKILDVRMGKPLPPNKYGELWLRGPSIMQGYLNNQEATSLAIDVEGWLRTGDLCYIDSRGLVYLVDRIKELIKYKAYQVAPAELEEVLSSHPGVQDVAVTSYPDEEAGEIPMACVVRKEGSKIKENDIFSFLEDKVAPYKKIRKVIFLEYIPRSPSGKILRRHLKAATSHQEKLNVSARL